MEWVVTGEELMKQVQESFPKIGLDDVGPWWIVPNGFTNTSPPFVPSWLWVVPESVLIIAVFESNLIYFFLFIEYFFVA